MCTGIAKRGIDLIYGFNLDIDPAVWSYQLHRTEKLFTVTITVGKRVYFTHGVNREGHFANLPYMNDNAVPKAPVGKKRERIDLLTDRYLRNQYSFEDVTRILAEKALVNVPNASMHTLLGDGAGRLLLLEPGYAPQAPAGDVAVITNYPLLRAVADDSPFYGKERYETAKALLSATGENFTAPDALRVLEAVKQDGTWATRLSFAYSRNENCVYFVENNDFTHVQKHCFAPLSV